MTNAEAIALTQNDVTWSERDGFLYGTVTVTAGTPDEVTLRTKGSDFEANRDHLFARLRAAAIKDSA